MRLPLTGPIDLVRWHIPLWLTDEKGTAEIKSGHTLASSINYFYKTHSVIYHQLLSVSILDRRVICLTDRMSG